jgi:hypothetical protein
MSGPWTPPPRTASCLETALWALEVGLWPILISAIDDRRFDENNRGKAPLGGKRWGKERRDARWFDASFRRNKGANVGLLLGPDGGLIDIDVDEPGLAGPVLGRLFPDGTPPTLGWKNLGKKRHLAFLWDDRLLPYVGKAGVIKGGPHYPGLELRLGGAGKQIQSVIPPSVLRNGQGRKWNGNPAILPLPESFFADLKRYGENEQPKPVPKPSKVVDPTREMKVPRPRGRAYGSDNPVPYALGALEREVAKVAAAPKGTRNDTLNIAAHSLGQLVGAGALERSAVEVSLAAAAESVGLGARETAATIASGIDKGMLKPRDLSGIGRPDGNGHHRRNGKASASRPSANGNGDGTTHATAEAGDDGPEDDEGEVLDRWPRIRREAFYGLAGDIVRAVDPHTEADPVAVLVQFLVAFANLVGRRAHFAVGATRHFLNLFVALTGSTATGRKGSAWDVVKWVLEPFDPKWANTRILGGLVSGEGLIHHVRDRVEEEREVEKGGKTVKQMVCVDPGVEDKRLLVHESEMARVLKSMNREANTLSGVMRQAWDGTTLGVMGKHRGEIATGAHISIASHVTRADVVKFLASEDSCNGFANRFLWVAARRSKLLPDGGDLLSDEFAYRWEPIKHRLERAVAFARECGRMKRDRAAGQAWHEVYGELSAGKPGLLGAVLGRAEAQTMRLACVFALLDESPLVCREHLGPALVLWKYCEDSARYVFGDSLSSPAGEKLLEALKAAPGGLARNQIFDGVFGRHKSRLEISSLLSELLTEGLVHRKTVKPETGRPAEVWFPGREEAESGAP